MSDGSPRTSRNGGRSHAPTLVQLRAFLAVCEICHFGRAAERLGVSQSTLSQALASLESAVGAMLVERTTRHVVVTPTGARLLPYARAAVEAADAFAHAASSAPGLLAGPLRLGLIPTVAPYLLPTLLATLRRRAPELALEVHEEQTARLLDALRVGDLDAVVLALPAGEPDLVELALYDEDFVVVVPAGHAWAGREDLAPEAVGGAGLLLLEPGHCLRDQTLELCAGRGAEREPGRSDAVSLPTIVQLVAGGFGVTVVPATALRVETRRARVAPARFAGDPPPGRRVGLAVRASAPGQGEYRDLARLIRAAVKRSRLPVRAF